MGADDGSAENVNADCWSAENVRSDCWSAEMDTRDEFSGAERVHAEKVRAEMIWHRSKFAYTAKSIGHLKQLTFSREICQFDLEVNNL